MSQNPTTLADKMSCLDRIKHMSVERARLVLATLVTTECIERWQFDRAIELSGAPANDEL